VSDNIKILMCSFPLGDRGPGIGYQNHKKAISLSHKLEIEEINQDILDNYLDEYDVFWFYVRFNPQLYYYLKKNFPNKKFVMGPNILFEKAEEGPSDDWEKWFVKNVESDIYFNAADYYLDRVKVFYSKSKKYFPLPYCIDLKNYDLSNNKVEKDIDVLIYSKKRRIDSQYENLFPEFINMINKSKYSYHVITYGNYSRKEYFDLVKRSKVCVWFSIEDYCSNAQLECQLLNCPIVGTKYNLTDTFDKEYWVDGHVLDENWLSWNERLPELYMEGVNKVMKNLNTIKEKPTNFILDKVSSLQGAIDVDPTLGDSGTELDFSDIENIA